MSQRGIAQIYIVLGIIAILVIARAGIYHFRTEQPIIPAATIKPAPSNNSGTKVIDVNYPNAENVVSLNKGQVVIFQYQNNTFYDISVMLQDPALATIVETTDQYIKLQTKNTGTTKIYVTLSPKCRNGRPMCELPSKIITHTLIIL